MQIGKKTTCLEVEQQVYRHFTNTIVHETITHGTTLHPEWDTESNPGQGRESTEVLWHAHVVKWTNTTMCEYSVTKSKAVLLFKK